MSKTVNDIFTDLYDLRDTTTGALTTAKKYAAINNALNYFGLKCDWRFTRRKKYIDYLQDEADYSIGGNLSIDDFKNPDELRLAYEEGVNFTFEEPEHFSLLKGRDNSRNFYTVDEKDNNKLLRINYPGFSKSSTLVNGATALSDNGTWTADGDATNARSDDNEKRYGGGSVRFDNDAYSSGTIALYNSDFQSIDLSDYEDIGHLRVWLYVPSTAYLESSNIMFLRWGPDSSNYWQAYSDTNSIGNSFEVGWNLVDFPWLDATKTGSPDSSAIGYLYFGVNVTASQVADTDWRINRIKAFQPEKLEFIYYSNYLIKSSAGVWKASANDTSDILLIPDEVYPAFKAKMLELLFRQLRGPQSADALYWNSAFAETFNDAKKAWGFPNKHPMSRMKPHTRNWKRHGISR